MPHGSPAYAKRSAKGRIVLRRFLLLPLIVILLLAAACGDDPVSPAPAAQPSAAPQQEQEPQEPQAQTSDQQAEQQTKQPAAQQSAQSTQSGQSAQQQAPEPSAQAQQTRQAAQAEAEPDPQSAPAAQIVLTDAVNFTVEYVGSAKLVHVQQVSPGAPGAVYVLVQRGAIEPEGGWIGLAGGLIAAHDLASATVVEIPIRSLFTSSTTQLPALEILGVVDSLTGVAQQAFVTTASVRALIDAGQLVEFAATYAVDAEAVVAAQPDVLMTSGFWDDAYDIIQSAGTAIVHNADWVESSPLGRAEWVKFISLFFNREAEAEAWFEGVRADYAAARALAAGVERRPTVHTGQVWGGVWYASGGQSYVARLLADAGADYVWAGDDSAGSTEHDIETQLAQAADAEFWLHAASWWGSIADALAEDARYGEFASLRNGNVWNPTLATNEQGGNDFFESGSVRPDLVLRDMIAILHPALLPDHEFVYYQRMPAE